jgi:hypothetical protein
MLYFNIIWKNIVKFFQKFEVGHIQACTPLEGSIMWHPKGGHHNVFSLITKTFIIESCIRYA